MDKGAALMQSVIHLCRQRLLLRPGPDSLLAQCVERRGPHEADIMLVEEGYPAGVGWLAFQGEDRPDVLPGVERNFGSAAPPPTWSPTATPSPPSTCAPPRGRLTGRGVDRPSRASATIGYCPPTRLLVRRDALPRCDVPARREPTRGRTRSGRGESSTEVHRPVLQWPGGNDQRQSNSGCRDRAIPNYVEHPALRRIGPGPLGRSPGRR